MVKYAARGTAFASSSLGLSFVDPIRGVFLFLEVMPLNKFRLTLWPPFATAILVIPHKFFLLGVD